MTGTKILLTSETLELKKTLLKLVNTLTVVSYAQVTAEQFNRKPPPSYPVNKNPFALSKVKKLRK